MKKILFFAALLLVTSYVSAAYPVSIDNNADYRQWIDEFPGNGSAFISEAKYACTHAAGLDQNEYSVFVTFYKHWRENNKWVYDYTKITTQCYSHKFEYKTFCWSENDCFFTRVKTTQVMWSVYDIDLSSPTFKYYRYTYNKDLTMFRNVSFLLPGGN